MQQIIAQILGLIATTAIVLSFQCKKIKYLFLFQFIASLLFTIHFFMLGAYIGCLMNLVGLIRNGLFALGEKTHKKPVLFMLLAMIVAFAIIGWQEEGYISLLPFVAQIVGTLVLWTGNSFKIRFYQLTVISPGWIVYNGLNSSIGGVLCEIFNTISVLLYFARIRNEKKHKKV